MAPSNALTIHGNEKTMNLNSLVLANIQASPYFKVSLYELKTYHQVIDEIYYKVNHLEPWEKGSRKTAGQTGMCGGVRGVGAGGIVSSAYCLLYKLYTLRLTRKQLIGLCTHQDSTFIRALGLMYIRYTQAPNTFWEWYEPYLDDEEEVDAKAGGGNMMTIGEIAHQMLVKLEWYGTLFPRIPVPIQKDIERKLQAYKAGKIWNQQQGGQIARPIGGENDGWQQQQQQQTTYDGGDGEPSFGEAERMSRRTDGRDSSRPAPPPRRSPPARDSHHGTGDRHSSSRRHETHRSHSSRHSPERRHRSRSRSHHREKRRSHDRHVSKSREHRSRSHEEQRGSKSREDRHKSKSRDERHRSRSREDRHKRSHDRRSSSRQRDSTKHKRQSKSPEDGFEKDLQKEIKRVRQLKESEGQNGKH